MRGKHQAEGGLAYTDSESGGCAELLWEVMRWRKCSSQTAPHTVICYSLEAWLYFKRVNFFFFFFFFFFLHLHGEGIKHMICACIQWPTKFLHWKNEKKWEETWQCLVEQIIQIRKRAYIYTTSKLLEKSYLLLDINYIFNSVQHLHCTMHFKKYCVMYLFLNPT